MLLCQRCGLVTWTLDEVVFCAHHEIVNVKVYYTHKVVKYRASASAFLLVITDTYILCELHLIVTFSCICSFHDCCYSRSGFPWRDQTTAVWGIDVSEWRWGQWRRRSSPGSWSGSWCATPWCAPWARRCCPPRHPSWSRWPCFKVSFIRLQTLKGSFSCIYLMSIGFLMQRLLQCIQGYFLDLYLWSQHMHHLEEDILICNCFL